MIRDKIPPLDASIVKNIEHQFLTSKAIPHLTSVFSRTGFGMVFRGAELLTIKRSYAPDDLFRRNQQ